MDAEVAKPKRRRRKRPKANPVLEVNGGDGAADLRVVEALRKAFKVQTADEPETALPTPGMALPPTPTTLAAFHRLFWDVGDDAPSRLLMAMDGRAKSAAAAPPPSHAHRLLQARMNAVFHWPALLTTVPTQPMPEDE